MSEMRDDERIAIDPGEEPASVAARLAELHPADVATALATLEPDAIVRILWALETDQAADVLTHLDEGTLEEILEVMGPPEIAEIAAELESDDATDVIGSLEESKRVQVLSRLTADDRREVERLLRYTDESAGGIMASEVVYVHEDASVGDAIEVLRAAADEVEDIHNVYVTDRQGRLRGVLSLRKLVLARPNARVSQSMDEDVVSVPTEIDQEDVAKVMSKYDLIAIPVVDNEGVLVGRITFDDIIDVIRDEAEEDFSIMAGTSEEEFHEDSVFRISRIRLPWLVVGALGGLASASVMSIYSVSLEKLIALAFFVPVITAMGGNVGLQTSTIIVRSMHLGVGLAGEAGARLLREWRIALTNALILGAALYGAVSVWFGDWRLGLVVGGSLATVILVAATLGTIMPFALRRVGVDPAVAQGPFVTTLNDVIGISVYLGLASAFIERLG